MEEEEEEDGGGGGGRRRIVYLAACESVNKVFFLPSGPTNRSAEREREIFW